MAAAEPLVIAIDGPSGVGKSTVARMLAARLDLPVLDTGAMYRAAALEVLDRGVDLDDGEAVARTAVEADVALRRAADGGVEVLLGGRPVGARIRTPEVSEATSRIATHPQVRSRMVAAQRAFATGAGAVVEGRDIGTVVFPDTPHKFFLDARPDERARRRREQLRAAGKAADGVDLESEIARRDARDRGRRVSPLRYDERYLRIDTSERTPEAVVEAMLEAIRARAPGPAS